MVFETTGFLFLVAGRRYFRAWLLTACVFHLVNGLVLNLAFHIHVPVYGVFLLSLKPLRGVWLQRRVQALGIAAASLLVVAHAALRIRGTPAQILFVADRDLATLVMLYASILLWAALLFLGAKTLVASPPAGGGS